MSNRDRRTAGEPTTPDAGHDAPRRRQRRSADDVDVVVLDAAAEILREAGVVGCTIEAVSRRSGVGKPSIYRRWPHRTALAIDAFARRMAIDVPYTDTGDARRDLTEAFVAIVDQYTGADGRIFRELLAAAVLEPNGAQLMRERFFLYRRERLLAIWQQGVRRGQLDPDVDPHDGIDLVFGAGIFRLLIGHQPITTEASRRLAQTVFRCPPAHAPDDQEPHRPKGAPNASIHGPLS